MAHKITDKRGIENETKPFTRPEKTTKLKEVYEIPPEPDYAKIGLEMKGDRVLIQDFPAASKIGSIFTPQGQEININRGRICAIGPEVKNLQVGEVVYKVHGLGQTLKDAAGNEYIFLPENSAIARDCAFKLPKGGEKK